MTETPVGGRYQLRRTQFIAKPVHEVFDFFAAPENLQILTPPFLNFKILTPSPIPMRVGTLIDYKLSLFGVPLNWRTRIEAFDPGHSFVDVALKSPYRLWHHLHTFWEVPGGTRMDDVVDYSLPLGPLGWVAHGIMVKQTLQRIFDYRAQSVKKEFGSQTDLP